MKRRRARPVTAALAVTAMLLAGSHLLGCDRGPSRRIVLITLDTLRYDSVPDESQPSSLPTLPAFGRLARSGLAFTHCYASTSQTQPTHASLFTGLHPWEHGVSRNGMILPERYETLAEILQASGFETRAVIASFPMQRRFGFGQGFDDFVETFDVAGDSANPDDATWNDVAIKDRKFYSLAEATTDRAIRTLDAATASRQFFWFHYYDPHAPYGDAASGLEAEPVRLPRLLRMASRNEEGFETALRRAREYYDRDVVELDRALARLLSRLDEDEEIPTTIVLTSDHGESFGEDGSLGHARRVSRPQVHVPLVLAGAGAPRGRRTDIASSIDVLPTLLALAGLEDRDLAGRDLLGETDPPSATAFGMRRTFETDGEEPVEDLRRVEGTWTRIRLEGNEYYAVLDGKIYSGNGSTVRCEDRPEEEIDSETTERLTGLFRHFENQLEGADVESGIDPETRRILERMGYIR